MANNLFFNNFNIDFVPATLDEAINYLYSILTPQMRAYIHYHHSSSWNFSYGSYLRTAWSLWEENTPFHQDIFNRFGLWGMGDDCTGLIFTGLWAMVKEQDIDMALYSEAEQYKKHWISVGINPETGKALRSFNKTSKSNKPNKSNKPDEKHEE